jgi:hypothetical protein
MLDNQYLFASVLLVAAGSRSPLPPAEVPLPPAVDISNFRPLFQHPDITGASTLLRITYQSVMPFWRIRAMARAINDSGMLRRTC